MKAVHILVAGFAPGDAISNQALLLQKLFRQWGLRSEIFSELRRVSPISRRLVRDARDCAAECRPEDAAVLELSIGSCVNEIFASLPCRKAVIYQNITPAEYFKGVNEETARVLEWGRAQARALASVEAVAMAASSFNARELENMGYRNVTVVPLPLEFPALRETAERSGIKKLFRGPDSVFADGKTNVLFVGRCAPNKRLEHVLYCFYYFQKYANENSRLILAGSYAGTERYYALLQSLVRKLALREVVFAGSVPQAELEALYRCARVFVCMSEHEGFCIPLLESMARGVPVLAYAAAAVPETMGGAGVLLREKRFDLASEITGALSEPGPFREAILAGQRARIERYMASDPAGQLRACLKPLLKPG